MIEFGREVVPWIALLIFSLNFYGRSGRLVLGVFHTLPTKLSPVTFFL